MKCALITDTHAGKRSDNVNLLDHQKLFYDEIFFPYLKQNEIYTVFHLGDLVDRRKYINFNTLNRLRTDFLDPISKAVDNFVIIAGNHDTFYKDRNELNALTELLGAYPRFECIIEPTEYSIYEPNKGKEVATKILLLPWICRDNEERSFNLIKKTKAKVCFGHLQLQGFEMHKGSFADSGFDKSLFDKFSFVASGHFHHKSDYDNIHYLGCPFQMDWGDYGDSKGFHIFDTETYDLTYVPNPYSLFHKIEYNDKETTLEKLLDFDASKYKKSFVRVITKNKENSFWFDSFIEKLEAADLLSLQVIEDSGNLAFDGGETDLVHVEDTITLLSYYCNQIGVNDALKPKLNELLQSLYNEANQARN